MAKKNQAPDAYQKQFNKIQFKINAPVIFTWLGMKKYGYVIRTKETNWGIQYTVQDVDAKYPCGISIKMHKTTYNTGCILADDTRSIGDIELKRRIQINLPSTSTGISSNPGGTKDACRSVDIDGRRILDKTSKQITNTRDNIRTDVVSSSSTRVCTDTTKKRAISKLDTAIQKQRDFLNGFITS
jgi:hypothetical protein